jgi:REP element-mobilizing transposase RayT
VNRLWYEIPNHFNNVKLDEFVIMPDHIHGIIVLNEMSRGNTPSGRHTPWPGPTGIGPLKSHSLSSIINQYKGSVVRQCKKLGFEFYWQKRFYDRIIRSTQALDNTRKYIINNPFIH